MTYKNVSTTPWMRSQNGWLFGVCEGLAESFDLSAGLVRAVWVLSLFFGFGFLLYFVAVFCLPIRGDSDRAYQPKFLGVCLRLSSRLNIDVGIVRMAMVFVALGSLGTTFIGYLILHFVIQEEVLSSVHLTKEQKQ